MGNNSLSIQRKSIDFSRTDSQVIGLIDEKIERKSKYVCE